MKYILTALILLVVVFVAYFMVEPFVTTYTFSPKTSTVSMIRCSYLGVSALQNKTNIESVLGSDSNSLTLNKNLEHV